MNRRNNIPAERVFPENTKRLIVAEFLRRRRCPATEKEVRKNALMFCQMAEMKIGNLTPCLRHEAQYHGATKTTEWAKEQLTTLAASIRHFRAVKREEGNVTNTLLQSAWVTLRFPLKHDLTPWNMLDMLAAAAERAAKTKRQRGKQPVSIAEAFMWGLVGKVFKEYARATPTATPAGFFSTVCEIIATGIQMDVPSRKVLQAAMAHMK